MSIDNAEIAAVFAELADLLQIQGEGSHRVNAFRRAATIIEALAEPVEASLAAGRLEQVPGLGKGTLARVREILARGTCEDLVRLRARLPAGLRDMLGIRGVGPSTVRALHQGLGITSVDELERAARAGAVAELPRMGPAMVAKLLRGIEALREQRGRVALGTAMRRADTLVEAMRDLAEVTRIEVAGSIRRRCATIGDIDILVASREPRRVIERFVSLVHVGEVLARGEVAASVRLHAGQQADLRVLAPESFGAALHYFTGSAQHNVAMRGRARALGLRINEYGVFAADGETRLDGCVDEERVFRAVSLPWIPPELREGAGELELAERGALPRLVEATDLRGDLHMHTVESDGRGTADEMVQRAREAGLEYVAITDHSKALGFARGLDEHRLLAQVHALRELEQRRGDLRIAAGTEVDILPDGSLDLDPRVLAQLDWVVASVHTHTEMSEADMTRRIVRAIESGVVDCIGHPTGRRPGRREPYAVDLERVFEAAQRVGVALECNGGPNRMDLSDGACRRARELGVPVVISTDAHSPRHVGRFEYGLAMARRGGLEAADVLNSRAWEQLAQQRRDRLRGVSVGVPVQVPASPAPTEFGAELDDDDAHAWGRA